MTITRYLPDDHPPQKEVEFEEARKALRLEVRRRLEPLRRAVTNRRVRRNNMDA